MIYGGPDLTLGFRAFIFSPLFVLSTNKYQNKEE